MLRAEGRARGAQGGAWFLVSGRRACAHGCGSKPMGSHFGVGAPHFSLI